MLPNYLSRVEALRGLPVEQASERELLSALEKHCEYAAEYWFSLSMLGGTIEHTFIQALERIGKWTPSLWEGVELLDFFRGFKSKPMEGQQRLHHHRSR